MAKVFILFDGRAKGGNPDDASVMDTADSERDARHAGRTHWRGYDAVWYECELDEKTREADSGRMRTDLPPMGVGK